MNNSNRFIIFLIFFLTTFLFIQSNIIYGKGGEKNNIRFIDYYFEHASPVSWIMQGDTIVKVFLMPDYERESLNRQTTHWYFRLEAETGTITKFILSKMMAGVYNGVLSTNSWNFKYDIPCYISYDNKTWEAIKTSKLPNNDLLVEFTMKGEYVYIARMPPYTISDLENLKKQITNNKLVKIFNVGTTVEKRPLDVIQLGNPNAPNSFLIRARAHPWESGGNWVVEGLINEFISQNSEKWISSFCVYIMPMANKDGVARGMSRFNIMGKDLNRNWDNESDPLLCPEKFALEKFIEGLIRNGIKPCLGIDLHNDDVGGIILAQHSKDDIQFVKNMQFFETLMRGNTSFSENVSYSWKNDGQSLSNVSFENGLHARYGVEAIVYELNANWMSGLGKVPSKNDWMEIGKNLNKVFYEYSNRLQ